MMNKIPLILTFRHLEIDFAKVRNGELIEKLFKSKPVAYLPTLVYCELFNIAYDNLVKNKDSSFAFMIGYQELVNKFDREVCTLSNALRSLHEAKLIVRQRMMVANDQPNSRYKSKPMLSIMIKLSASMQKSVQASAEQS